MAKTKTLTTIDLFSGCGGLTAGFEIAGFTSVLACDFWQPKITFKHNFPNCQLYEGDVKDLDEKGLSQFIGKVDVVIGGPPCQGFSAAGRKSRKKANTCQDGLSRNACRKDGLDALLAYAYNFIRTLENTWYEASIQHKIRLQKLVFPKGVEYQNGKFSDSKISPIFELIEVFGTENVSLVSQLSRRWNPDQVDKLFTSRL